MWSPFGFPFFPPVRRRIANLQRIDQRGIPVICTTDLVENTTAGAESATYGINACEWAALPCQTVIIWKVRQPISAAGADLPVSVAVPVGGKNSTVSSAGSAAGSGNVAGTAKIPVVDNKSTQVTGGDVTNQAGGGASAQASYTTEHWVYIDKASGIFRLLGVTAAAATPVSGS